MADQPERPIEKLLRECGKRRLPPQPLDLHPANRRLLQDEVARAYPKNEPRRPWFGIRPLPKLAWAFCAFSVFGIAVLVSIRRERQTAPHSVVTLDKEALAPALPVNTPIAQVKTETAPSLPPTVTLADNTATPAREADIRSTPKLQSTPAQPTDAASMVVMNLAEQQLASDVVARTEFAGAAPARALEPATPAAGLYRYGLAAPLTAASKQNLPTTIQNFVRQQTAAQVEEDRRVQPILTSFQFERSGSQVRIIDQDGSVYAGTLAPPQNQSVARAARQDLPVSNVTSGGFLSTKKPAPTAPADEPFTFHVTGTNRTLQELVSFDGRWSTLTNVSPVAVTQVSKDMGRKTAFADKILPAGPAAGRISGTATIRGSNAIDINAVSRQP